MRPEPLRDLLVPLESAGLDRRDVLRLGGKAVGLGRLLRAGFPVPSGWVLDARAFERAVEQDLPRGHDLPSLLRLVGTPSGIERAARARDRLLEAPLHEELRSRLALLWEELGPKAPWGLAVRSSATCEDGDDTTLAGMAATLLGVRGTEALEQAIRQVWASAFLPRALTYLARAGLKEVSMAVVLQPMVQARAAGVLFTAPPLGLGGPDWKQDERLIQATFGLGAPVVDGVSACDTLRVARADGRLLSSNVADKSEALVVGERGLEQEPLPAARRRALCLRPGELEQLTTLASRLDGLGPRGFDVEFAVTEDKDDDEEHAAPGREGERVGRVVLLQARPLGTPGYPEGGDAETVWSRANLGEALPGAATPLTWSVARGFAEQGFREAFAALGCRAPRGASLVASVQGRFYLNLTAFLRVLAQVPGLTPRKVLGLSGGASEEALALLDRQVEGVSRRGFFARLPFTATRLLAEQARLEQAVEAHDRKASKAERALLSMDLGLLPDDSLATTLQQGKTLLAETGSLMLQAASGALGAHLALCETLRFVLGRKTEPAGHRPLDTLWPIAEGSEPGDVEQLAQTLTGGARELESAAPGIALAHIAQTARREAQVAALLLAGGLRRVEDLPESATRRELERFLAVHGHRALREAELSVPRWREEPAHVLEMLTASLRAGGEGPEAALARARATADRELARLEPKLSVLELALVRNLVARAQRFNRLRERTRAWVTRVLGMLRVVALDVDRRLRRIDPSIEPGGVFFCTFEELRASLASGRAELGPIVRLRRAEHRRDTSRPDPPATFIGRPPPTSLPSSAGPRLQGLAASSGVVEGRARVLRPGQMSLDDLQPGEILVARTTDVGLSPLFLVAAGVVTELGGPLSHAAIVAREYGVPAVVSVPGATSLLRDGERLRVDGDRGLVERIAEDGSGSSAALQPPLAARP